MSSNRTKPIALKKGHACTCCRYVFPSFQTFLFIDRILFRRRKTVCIWIFGLKPLTDRYQRCDGKRPICTECGTTGRELDCEYADGFAPTRAELLQNYLEGRSRRAEDDVGPTRTELLQNYLERLILHADTLERRHAERGM